MADEQLKLNAHHLLALLMALDIAKKDVRALMAEFGEHAHKTNAEWYAATVADMAQTVKIWEELEAALEGIRDAKKAALKQENAPCDTFHKSNGHDS